MGNYRLSLVIARQLHEAGYGVIAGAPASSLIGASRYVDLCWDHPFLEKNPKVFLDSLDALIDHPSFQ